MKKIEHIPVKAIETVLEYLHHEERDYLSYMDDPDNPDPESAGDHIYRSMMRIREWLATL